MSSTTDEMNFVHPPNWALETNRTLISNFEIEFNWMPSALKARNSFENFDSILQRNAMNNDDYLSNVLSTPNNIIEYKGDIVNRFHVNGIPSRNNEPAPILVKKTTIC